MTQVKAPRYISLDLWISWNSAVNSVLLSKIIIPIGSALSLADEKAECVTMSMTNYLCRNARAVLATSGQITLVIVHAGVMGASASSVYSSGSFKETGMLQLQHKGK